LQVKQIKEFEPFDESDETLFQRIARDIEIQGYSICPHALNPALVESLYRHQLGLKDEQVQKAGIGRGEDYLKNHFIRRNKICWINGESSAGQAWLSWTAGLKTFLNRRLFLGLFSFESHFAHYRPGDFYRRHYDAFRGEANRVLSVVAYFNSNWTSSDGGELVLYKNEDDREGIKVFPLLGTLVVFLSEEFPHEVLPAKRDRYSIAGWFRVNASRENMVDPPF